MDLDAQLARMERRLSDGPAPNDLNAKLARMAEVKTSPKSSPGEKRGREILQRKQEAEDLREATARAGKRVLEEEKRAQEEIAAARAEVAKKAKEDSTTWRVVEHELAKKNETLKSLQQQLKEKNTKLSTLEVSQSSACCTR